MRLNARLEEVNGCRAFGVGFHFVAGNVGYFRHFVNERNYVAEELHHAAYTHVFACAYAEHREDVPFN